MLQLFPLIKKIIRPLTFPLPTGIAAGGSRSRFHRPRKVAGAEHVTVGRRSHILGNSWINCVSTWEGTKLNPRLTIGDDVYIGHYSCITCAFSVTIEDGVVISEHIYISDCSHGLDPERGPIHEQPLESSGPVVIGSHSFLGYRTSILPGVTLGHHCVVGAHSVVTRSFPPYSMIFGVPARLIKRYSETEKRWVSV
jgi:acetyltransferase-like isoleucine patch superfamily enzyme